MCVDVYMTLHSSKLVNLAAREVLILLVCHVYLCINTSPNFEYYSLTKSVDRERIYN